MLYPYLCLVLRQSRHFISRHVILFIQGVVFNYTSVVYTTLYLSENIYHHKLMIYHQCSFLFTDSGVVRQLMFQAKYAMKCSLISDEVSREALTATAEQNFMQILEICNTGK